MVILPECERRPEKRVRNAGPQNTSYCGGSGGSVMFKLDFSNQGIAIGIGSFRDVVSVSWPGYSRKD